jgi:hypothetical protein
MEETNITDVKGQTPLIKNQLTSTAPDYDDISILGVSLRGIITFLTVATVCGLCAAKIPIDETLKAIVFVCIGFYFKK